jgi:hypothetical protein
MLPHTRAGCWLAVWLLLVTWPATAGLAPERAADQTLDRPAPVASPPDTIYGITATGFLVRFSAATPSVFDLFVPISGLGSRQRLSAIDFQPKTGELYGLSISGLGNTAQGRLYTVNTATGAATQVGTLPFASFLPATAGYDMDFNPVADRLRLVNTAGDNLRLNPTTGALAATDTSLSCSTPPCEVVGVAYDRDAAGATASTLFGLDWKHNNLVTIGGLNGSPSANGGVLTTIGPLGLSITTTLAGFDIAPSGLAYAALNIGSQYRLYRLNLNTGTATLVGLLSNGTVQVIDIAVPARFNDFLPLMQK